MEREKENKEYCKRVVDEMVELYEQGILTVYFDDVLDLEYIVNRQKEFVSVKVFVTLGGPTCWIDTHEKKVKLTWGNEKASWCIPSDVCDYIDEIFQEIYEC